jgi:hypothetical protein
VVRVHPAMTLRDILLDKRMVVANVSPPVCFFSYISSLIFLF